MRADLETTQEWVPVGSRILDLDYGDGKLLAWLCGHKQVSGYGLEIDPDNTVRRIEDGVNATERGLNRGLGNFANDSFDVVVIIQALQAIHYPGKTLGEILRVGKICIITFPSSGHWRYCWYLACNDRMPASEFLSYTWYNTPNIHFCTSQGFKRLRRQLRIRMLDRLAVDRDRRHGWTSRL